MTFLAEPFRQVLRAARLRLLRMHFEARVGHIGGNLSALDAVLLLHRHFLGPDDLFILSKGHAAGALYVALWSQGALSDDDLRTFHQDDTLLSGHPAAGWHPGIRFATGSLGHGAGLAAGTGLARRLAGRTGRVYCFLSDGEWQEGSTWEALTFIGHHGLDNVTLVVDVNGLQGFGTTMEVASQGSLGAKLEAFGFTVREVDGHNPSELHAALASPPPTPHVVLLQTTKGHGVSFMGHRVEWHYLPMSEAQYLQAVAELEAE